MAEVFIDSLTLKNFGPFYGEHTLDFRSLEGKCGILVGGKTGAGKTHLLRALYLAVVGESGVGDLKRVETGSDATRFAFEKSLNRRAQTEGEDTVHLKAVITLRDEKIGSRKVELRREIRYRPNSSPVWEHYAVRSDTPGRIEDEQVIQKLRDAFLPRHLARFFFFDAERSQSINLGQQDIVEGVSRILGLWTYGELESDLRQLQQKIPRAFNGPSTGTDPETRLADLSADVLRVDGHWKARKKERDALQRELHEVEAELLEVEDDLKTLGAVDPDELLRSQERRSELTRAKTDLEAKLNDAWEVAFPVALLGEYRKELHDYLQSEERRREWENAKSTVEPKIPQVKEAVFGDVPDEFALQPDAEAFYMGRLEDALHGLFHPPPEGIPDRVFAVERNDVSAQIRARLATAAGGSIGELAEICGSIELMDVELRELEQKLKQMQQNTAAFKHGTELHQKRGELITRRSQLNKRVEELDSEISRLEVEVADLKRQETTQREVVERAQKGESLAALAARYREAAADIRSRAAIQMRRQISEHVGRLWVEITEREREFDGMEFDSHWQCWLLRRDGKKLTWEETNTSAGQRQVRMLAFYEALRRLAKLVPPLVVDTPLARLDKEVRANVLDRLYLSGHQSVILSTNAEIDPEGPLFDRIRDRVARVYTLNPHGRPDSPNYEVRITSDYFGRDV